MNSNVEILDDIDKVTIAARNDFNQKNLENIFYVKWNWRTFEIVDRVRMLARKCLCDSCSV